MPKSSSSRRALTLEVLKQIIPGLAETFGPNCEVVLHDLSRPDSSVVAISGNVTGRKVGAPLTDLVLRTIQSGSTDENLINYRTYTRDGKPLKSSTIFIRDSWGKPVACLCINYDLSDFMLSRKLLEDFCIPAQGEASNQRESMETFAEDVTEMLTKAIVQALEQVGKPVSRMDREDKLKVVELLDGKGIFLIKGAVDRIAATLGISRYTVYGYLEQIKAQKESPSHL